MDLGPSIWLSSVTGALLFFSGGRLWGRASARREVLVLPTPSHDGATSDPKPEAAPAPTPPPHDDSAARVASAALAQARAENDALTARQACAEVSRALDAEVARGMALQGQLSLAERRVGELRDQLAVARAGAEHAARLDAENRTLQREVEDRRRAEGRLADVQRQTLEVATRTHLLDRRRSELDSKEAENETLRRDVARLTIQAGEVEGLRSKVRDLKARGFALEARVVGPAPARARPRAGQKLEEAIEDRLDELRRRLGSCQTAVLADLRGLLLASVGDATHEDALAAAASLTTEASERLRQLLPLGEPMEIRLTDVNRVVFTARWLRDDQEKFLLGTLGVTKDKTDPRADAIEASISDLLRAPPHTTLTGGLTGGPGGLAGGAAPVRSDSP
jgi:hypothetical protein